MNAVQQALFLEVGDVLVNRGQALQVHSAGNLFKRRGIAVAGHERFQKVDDLFLPSRDSHGRIIAKKKRIARRSFLPFVLHGAFRITGAAVQSHV